MAFPDRLHTAMTLRRISRPDLAKQIGRSTSSVHAMLQGQQYPSLEAFAALCRALNVSPAYLLGATPELELPPAAA
jgi:transcriptional regulator with XRE-family HTH domain